MSSSRSSGISHAISLTRNSTASSASRSTARRLRNSPSIFATRVPFTRSRTRPALSGGNAMARSRSTSTAMPPAPNVRAGPKTGSRTTPTSSSRAWVEAAMGSIVTPASRALGRFAATEAIIAVKLPRTAAASAISSRTPSTSLLCGMSGESIFIATGKPTFSAAATAASADAACSVGTTGMRNA